MAKIDVIPADAPIGAEIRGPDVSQPLDDETFEAVQAAFDEYRVVFFRDQTLTPDQQIAFARRLGKIEFNAFSKYALDGHPEIATPPFDRVEPWFTLALIRFKYHHNEYIGVLSENDLFYKDQIGHYPAE